MSSTSQASWPTALFKRDDPSIAEYAQQPNLRLLCSFCLGWVFVASLYSIVISTLVQDAFRRTARSVRALIRKPSVIADPEAPPTPHEKPPTVISNESLSVQRNHDRNSLIFTLNLCFAFAGLAQFISLLVFNSQTAWDTGCAFIVAWGGMSSQCARLVGIIILTLDLKRSHIRRSESWSLWAGVVIALAFVFATNAVNTGTTRQLAPYGSFCFRKHSLPVPLTSSIIHLVLELYITMRLMTVRLPPSPRVWDVALSLSNVNMARAASLIALDLLTIVPDAITTSIVVQFVPFCLGALLVLAAFNVSLHSPGSPVLLVTGPIVNIDPAPSVASPKEAENEPPSILNIAPTEPPKRKAGRNVSHASSMQSLETTDTDIAGSVEGAVVSRAVRYMPSPETPAFPHSAPARFGDAAETIQGSRDRRHILPSQSLFVEEIEHPSQESGPTGPTVRRQAARPPMTIVVHPEDSDESHSPGAGTPGSAIFGSDIVQPTPGLRRVDEKSPAVDPHASVVLSPRDSVFTAQHPVHRDSTTSTQYVATPSEYSPEETRFSAFSRRVSAGRNSLLGRDALKSPWRTISRYSFASARTKSREELPTLPEGEASDGASSSHRSRSRKRTTFGQISSKRAGKEPAYLTSPREPDEPVPPLPRSILPPLTIAPGGIRSLPIPPMTQSPSPEPIPDASSSSATATAPAPSGSQRQSTPPQLPPLDPPRPLSEFSPPESPTTRARERERALGSGQIRGPRPRPSEVAPEPSSSRSPEPDVEDSTPHAL